MPFIASFFNRLFALPRTQKKKVLLIIDALASSLAVGISYLVNFHGEFQLLNLLKALWVTPLVHVIVAILIGNYRTSLRFIDNRSILSLIFPAAISSFALLTTRIELLSVALSLSLAYFFVVLALVFFTRLLPQYVSRVYSANSEPVIIYGAGGAGKRLLSSLAIDQKLRPCALIDDNPALSKVRINGIGVHKPNRLPSLLKTYNCSKVLLAMPSATKEQRVKILKLLESLRVEVQTVPSLGALLSNHRKINQFEELDINDLLGREPVSPNVELMHKCIKEKSVLVTGAGGSIGSELCRQILKQNPKYLILYELSEFNLYQVDQDLRRLGEQLNCDTKIVTALGDVKNIKRLSEYIKHYGVKTIYHAAAYKHVPIVEHNVTQGVHNNVIGSYNVAELACEYDIESCVLVSTDKAVRPTNVMGATKRLSELCFQAYAKAEKCKTVFSMVRFGNVLGSSGSVVPLFREQIKSGTHVTVTHKEITRFFMTIPEASELVIQAGAMAEGGEVFVLDMGEPVKIFDLAKKMIHLMGQTVRDEDGFEEGIEIRFTGLRPGEKLYEELLIGGDVEGTSHSRIMMSQETYIDLPELEAMVDKIKDSLRAQNSEQLISLLIQYCDGFDHKSGNSDNLKEITDLSQSKVVMLNN